MGAHNYLGVDRLLLPYAGYTDCYLAVPHVAPLVPEHWGDATSQGYNTWPLLHFSGGSAQDPVYWWFAQPKRSLYLQIEDSTTTGVDSDWTTFNDTTGSNVGWDFSSEYNGGAGKHTTFVFNIPPDSDYFIDVIWPLDYSQHIYPTPPPYDATDYQLTSRADWMHHGVDHPCSARLLKKMACANYNKITWATRGGPPTVLHGDTVRS
jgi:hypothetical protein